MTTSETRPGTFITFEGIDGSGKSTQLKLLANFLNTRKCDFLLTREPGGTPVGNKLRAALLDAHEEVDPLAELLVFAADRAQHVRRVLRPALEAGQVVFSDRYADATAAYQGAGRGFPPNLISEIIELATEGLTPDLHARVRDEYLRIAHNNPDRVKVVETNRPIEETQEQVKQIIVPFLTSRGHLSEDAREQTLTISNSGE
jgi:dTMP kinase